MPILALAAGLVACGRGGAAERETASLVPARQPQRPAQPQQPQPASPAGGGVNAGGSPPPGASLRNPFEGDARAAQEGGRLFSAYNCDGCHGGGAVGAIGPSLSDGRWRYGGSAGAIYETIYRGRPNGMPAFGGVIPEAVLWKIVTYLQSLQPSNDEPTVSF